MKDELQSGIEDQESYHVIAERARIAKRTAIAALIMATAALCAGGYALTTKEPLIGTKWTLYTRTFGGDMAVYRGLSREDCESRTQFEPAKEPRRIDLMEAHCAPE